MSFSLKIKELRKLKDLSQEQVGDYLGVSKQMISKYEQGKSLPEWVNVEKMAKLFEVDLSILKGLWLTSVDFEKTIHEGEGDTRSIKEALGDVSTRLYIEQEKNKALRAENDKLKKELTQIKGIRGTGTE